MFDTYGEDTKNINGGKIYYQWKPSSDDTSWNLTSSGCGTKEGVWVGDHDCREALLFNMRRLEENGQFVSPWSHPHQSVFPRHYADPDYTWDDPRRDDLYNNRLLSLPDHVKTAIGVDRCLRIPKASKL